MGIENGKAVIALLDALGIRTSTLNEAAAFISDSTDMIEELESQEHKRISHITSVDGVCQETEAEPLRPNVMRFGDTILITTKQFENKPLPHIGMRDSLRPICKWVRDFMAIALTKGYLFRGAIAYGEYSTNWNDVFVGPVVADAAGWYEEPRMVGAMLTPNTFKQLADQLNWRQQPAIYNMGGFYRTKYWPIKTKNRGIVESLVVDWPRVYSEEWFKKEVISEHLKEIERSAAGTSHAKDDNIWDGIKGWYEPYNYIVDYCLYQGNIPIGTEDIYSNSLDFIMSSMRDVADLERISKGASKRKSQQE